LSIHDLKKPEIKVMLEPEDKVPRRKKKEPVIDDDDSTLIFDDIPQMKDKVKDHFPDKDKAIVQEEAIIVTPSLEVELELTPEIEEVKEVEINVEKKKKLSMSDLKKTTEIKVLLEPENKVKRRKKKEPVPADDEPSKALIFDDIPQTQEVKDKVKDHFPEREKQVVKEESIVITASLGVEQEVITDTKVKVSDHFPERKEKIKEEETIIISSKAFSSTSKEEIEIISMDLGQSKKTY